MLEGARTARGRGGDYMYRGCNTRTELMHVTCSSERALISDCMLRVD